MFPNTAPFSVATQLGLAGRAACPRSVNPESETLGELLKAVCNGVRSMTPLTKIAPSFERLARRSSALLPGKEGIPSDLADQWNACEILSEALRHSRPFSWHAVQPLVESAVSFLVQKEHFEAADLKLLHALQFSCEHHRACERVAVALCAVAEKVTGGFANKLERGECALEEHDILALQELIQKHSKSGPAFLDHVDARFARYKPTMQEALRVRARRMLGLPTPVDTLLQSISSLVTGAADSDRLNTSERRVVGRELQAAHAHGFLSTRRFRETFDTVLKSLEHRYGSDLPDGAVADLLEAFFVDRIDLCRAQLDFCEPYLSRVIERGRGISAPAALGCIDVLSKAGLSCTQLRQDRVRYLCREIVRRSENLSFEEKFRMARGMQRFKVIDPELISVLEEVPVPKDGVITPQQMQLFGKLPLLSPSLGAFSRSFLTSAVPPGENLATADAVPLMNALALHHVLGNLVAESEQAFVRIFPLIAERPYIADQDLLMLFRVVSYFTPLFKQGKVQMPRSLLQRMVEASDKKLTSEEEQYRALRPNELEDSVESYCKGQGIPYTRNSRRGGFQVDFLVTISVKGKTVLVALEPGAVVYHFYGGRVENGRSALDRMKRVALANQSLQVLSILPDQWYCGEECEKDVLALFDGDREALNEYRRLLILRLYEEQVSEPLRAAA